MLHWNNRLIFTRIVIGFHSSKSTCLRSCGCLWTRAFIQRNKILSRLNCISRVDFFILGQLEWGNILRSSVDFRRWFCILDHFIWIRGHFGGWGHNSRSFGHWLILTTPPSHRTTAAILRHFRLFRPNINTFGRFREMIFTCGQSFHRSLLSNNFFNFLVLLPLRSHLFLQTFINWESLNQISISNTKWILHFRQSFLLLSILFFNRFCSCGYVLELRLQELLLSETHAHKSIASSLAISLIGHSLRWRQ